MSRLVVKVVTVETNVHQLQELGDGHRFGQQLRSRREDRGHVRAEHAAIHGMQVVGRHLEVRGIPIPVSVLPAEEPWLQTNQDSRVKRKLMSKLALRTVAAGEECRARKSRSQLVVVDKRKPCPETFGGVMAVEEECAQNTTRRFLVEERKLCTN